LSERKKVEVSVYGMNLSIVSSEDPAKTKEYADYADEMMRDIASRIGGDTGFSRVSALALLQMSHELFAAREDLEAERGRLEERMDKILKELESAVSESGEQPELGQLNTD